MSKKQSTIPEDYIWMSYRYCIGRSTIASHCHAGTIANDVYGKLSEARMQFMSEDICSEIHDRLHYHNFIDFDWYGNIPKEHFKPLDVVISILVKEGISSKEEIRKIKTIAIDWNREKTDYDYSIYYFNDDDKNKDNGRSMSDIEDLMVWQRLANLLDSRCHKWCRLTDDSLVEYYEYWRKTYNPDGPMYERVKTPVESYHNFSVCKYIPQESIKEDYITV